MITKAALARHFGVTRQRVDQMPQLNKAIGKDGRINPRHPAVLAECEERGLPAPKAARYAENSIDEWINKKHGGKRKAAYEALGISRATLNRWIKKGVRMRGDEPYHPEKSLL